MKSRIYSLTYLTAPENPNHHEIVVTDSYKEIIKGN